MIWDIILVIILALWIIIYLKNKKAILSLPYLLMLFFTPIYNILDQKIFVEIFGCGCVPSAQTNMFNIDFNANDLRLIVYNIFAFAFTVFGLFLSKKIENLGTSGISQIMFLIGGSLGMSENLLKRADCKLSFSKMTFPHQLMRVILLEQVYRSYRIMNGEPYHK